MQLILYGAGVTPSAVKVYQGLEKNPALQTAGDEQIASELGLPVPTVDRAIIELQTVDLLNVIINKRERRLELIKPI